MRAFTLCLARCNYEDINISVSTEDRRTPLHLACATGNLAMAQLLIWVRVFFLVKYFFLKYLYLFIFIFIYMFMLQYSRNVRSIKRTRRISIMKDEHACRMCEL